MTDGGRSGSGAVHFRPSEAPWADDRTTGRIPAAMLEAADRLGGGGRKFLADGQGGFHSTYSEVPAGYVMATHRHDVDELFIVLSGGCTWSDGQISSAQDSVVLPAGVVHGYTVGRDGLHILTVSMAPFETVLLEEGEKT